MEKKKLWENIKKSVEDGVKTAAEKTEEYTKLGKAKLDILAVKRKIGKNFTELGSIVYEASKDKKAADILKSEDVKSLIDIIKGLEEDLDNKEEALEEMTKKESGEEKTDEKDESK